MFDGPAWTEARNRIVLENLDWAYSIADKALRRLPTWFSREDMRAHVEIALIKKADEYRGYQCVPFRAFAVRRITGACYDAIRRKEYVERSHVSMDVQGEDGTTMQVADTAPLPDRLAELAEMKGIWEHVKKLPTPYAIVIRRIYGEGWTGLQVARELGNSEGMVSRMRSEALAMLRELMQRPATNGPCIESAPESLSGGLSRPVVDSKGSAILPLKARV